MTPQTKFNYPKNVKTRRDSLLADMEISERSKALILKFVDRSISDGVGSRRIEKYFGQLKKIYEMLGKDFDKARKKDIVRIVGLIATNPEYQEWTKWSYRVMIKKLWKWLRYEGGKKYPPEVDWIKSRLGKCRMKAPEDILNKEELEDIINLCENDRDRCLIAMLYDSGARIGEILGIKLKDITDGHPLTTVLVNAEKTGDRRRIPLYESIPYLVRWRENHPNKRPESHLFVNFERYIGLPMIYQSVTKLFKRINDKYDGGKNIYPHLFRHSRATELANHLTESQMNEFFGWRMGSKMASVYIHLSGRDIDNALLNYYGIAQDHEKKIKKLETRICERCKEKNLPSSKLCCNCGMPFDADALIEQNRKIDMLVNLLEKKDVFEKLIDARLEERLNEMGEKAIS